MMIDSERFDIQADLYQFPYHYLPTLDETGAISICKFLSWGLDYLTYMTFIADLITDKLNAQSLLDVGCGDGRLLNMLRGKIPRMVGVDLVEQAIFFARAFNPDIEFYLCDVAQVPGQFQVISLVEVMEHLPDKDYPEFVDKVAQKILPDGRLVVSVPTLNITLNRKHYRHYDLCLLQKQLSSAFLIEDYWFLSRQGRAYEFFRWLLQNQVGIVLPGFWRRMVWRLHRRYSYLADASSGAHLIAIAKPVC